MWKKPGSGKDQSDFEEKEKMSSCMWPLLDFVVDQQELDQFLKDLKRQRKKGKRKKREMASRLQESV